MADPYADFSTPVNPQAAPQAAPTPAPQADPYGDVGAPAKARRLPSSNPDLPPIDIDENGKVIGPPAQPRPNIGDEVRKYAADLPGNVGRDLNNAINIAGTQFTKGINSAIGLPNTLQDLGMQAISKLRGVPYAPPQTTLGQPTPQVGQHVMPTVEDANRFVFGSLGVPERNMPSIPFQPAAGGPTIDLGKAADAGLQSIPTFGGQGLYGALPGFAAGAGSELAGQATAGTPLEPFARVGGGVAGYRAGAKAVTPLPAKLTPNEARAVQIAKDNGLPMSVSQETGRGQMADRIISRFPTGEGPYDALKEKQALGTDRMALKEAGVEGEHTDPESMKDVSKTAKANFRNALKDVGTVGLSDDFYNKLGGAEERYRDLVGTDVKPIVPKTIDKFLETDMLSSDQYQSYRKSLNDMMQGLNPGTQEYQFLKATRGALDDAMEASAPAEKAAAMQLARKQYANYKIIQKAAANSTAAAKSEGHLSPNALEVQLKKRQGDDYSETTGGLNDVVTLKRYLADKYPNSGTPTVGAGHAMMGGGAAMVGEHGAAILHDPKLLAAAAMLTGVPRVAANVMTGQGKLISPLLHRYLVNQAMVNANPGLYGGGIRSVPFSLAPGIAVAAPPLLEGRQ